MGNSDSKGKFGIGKAAGAAPIKSMPPLSNHVAQNVKVVYTGLKMARGRFGQPLESRGAIG